MHLSWKSNFQIPVQFGNEVTSLMLCSQQAEFLPPAYGLRREVIFSVCLSVHIRGWGGGGGTPSASQNTSTGPMSFLVGCTPVPGGGYPWPGQDGVPPPPLTGYAWTGHAAGGTPLAVSRMTFLFVIFSNNLNCNTIRCVTICYLPLSGQVWSLTLSYLDSCGNVTKMENYSLYINHGSHLSAPKKFPDFSSISEFFPATHKTKIIKILFL